jgi:phosphorylcholine metabolism protein LicD
MKKIAVFDFDGSLSKGYISMGFLDFLYEKELYPKSYYKKQQSILKKYKAKKLSYEKWCALWGKYWIEGFKRNDSRI